MKILFNGQIHTQNPNNPNASAIAIDNGLIKAVGFDWEIFSKFGKNHQNIDLNGLVIIPGLIDAHIHLDFYANSLQQIDCETPSLTECLYRVGEKAKSVKPGEWIIGHGWNQNNWAEGYGTAEMLDSIAPVNPVFLTHKSLHAAWVNTQALKFAGITDETSDPAEGIIMRDSHGKPNGILLESAAWMIKDKIPPKTIEELADILYKAQNVLWQMGITGVHDNDQARCFAALQLLHAKNDLHLRVIKNIPLDNLSHAIALGLRSGFGDDWLKIGGIKCFADGALGPQTAAMILPYENSLNNVGDLSINSTQLFNLGRDAVDNGFNLVVHAIGDRANREILDGFERLRTYEKQSHKLHFRHRIEHAQLIHPDDVKRFAELDIIASVQPIHATSDMLVADRYWGNRSEYAYAFKTLQQLGTHIAFGSDAPVESPNPFWGIHASVTRQRHDGTPGVQGWRPGQKISVDKAIEAYTVGAAFAVGMEACQGKIQPGYYADLIALDHDPYSYPVDQLYRLSPVKTMVGGEWVWQA